MKTRLLPPLGIGRSTFSHLGTAFVACILFAVSFRAPAQIGPGYALTFNGANNYVAVNAQNVPIGNSDYTVEAWIKADNMGNYGIVGWGNYGTSNQVNVLALRTNGLINSWGSNDLAYTNTGLAGAWHHVAATYDGTWRKLYVDGTFVASNSPPANHNVTTRTNLTIGLAAMADYFNGTIDEVRIWGEARTQSQIRSNRFTRLSGSESGLNAYWRLDEGMGTAADDSAGPWNPGTLVNNPSWVRSGATNAPDALTTNATSVTTASARLNARVHPGNVASKAWFQWGSTVSYGANTALINVGPDLPADPNTLSFEIGSVLTNLAVNATYHYRVAVTNSAGTNYGLDGVFTTATLPTGPGCALLFDGLNDYVEFNRPVADDFTLECWFRTTQIAGNDSNWWEGMGLVDGEVGGYMYDFGLSLGAGKVLFGTGGGYGYETTIRSEEVVADGTWHHVAATRQRSNGAMRLYVDGNLVASDTGTTLTLNSPTTMRLGSLATDQHFYQGQIDEVRIWNTVRSQSQIQAYLGRPLAGNEAGLVAYFKLDECSGTLAADITGHGYDGVLVNGPTWTNSFVPYGPFVLTLPATNLTTTVAGLRGSINAEGFSTAAWFEWGTTTNYGSTTLVTNVGSNTNTITLSTNIGVLPSFATYHFRAVAINSYGTSYGEDQSFWLGPPIAITQPAIDITTNAATLGGTVIASGPSAQAWFQWGLTTNYGSASVQVSIGSGTIPVVVTNRPTGLIPGATYHYRVGSSNSFGIDYGEDLTFTNAFLAQLAALSGRQFSAMAWGDFDLDGDLDLVVCGWADTRLFQNNSGAFAEVAVPLGDLGYGSISVGDCNNDGWPDILLTGTDASWGARSEVWTNTGSGWGLAVSSPSITAVTDSSCPWGDFDNDGRLDILLTGGFLGTAVAEVWRNTGNGFVLSTSLPGVYYSSAAWGDYDNDGYLDILLAGVVPDGTGTNYITRLYHNNGDRTFTLLPTTLPGVCHGDVAWGDFDNDGRLDILLTGSGMSGNVSAVFRNDGHGAFTDINAGLIPLTGSSAAWGDFDNDGWLDIALIGQKDGGGDAALIYHNNGDGTFTLVANTGFIGGWEGALAVADYDKDGRLDLAVTGYTNSTRIHHNLWPTTNTPPTGPANLVATVMGTNVVLSWTPGSDSKTPTPGLSYNLRVGTAPGISNIVSSLAAGNGWRRVPQLGNLQQNLSVALAGLKYGSNYYWSVQAIDTSFAGSPFECGGMFSVTLAPSSCDSRLGSIMGNSAVLTAAVYPNGSPTTAYIQWGTTAGYGNNTATINIGSGMSPVSLRQSLSGLLPGTLYHYRVVTSNANGTTYGPDQTFYVDPIVLIGDANGDGVVDQSELDTVLANYWPTSPWLYLINVAGLGGTNVTFALTNSTAGAFSVMMSTNLMDWDYLGPATPRYEYTDTNAPSVPQRFYRLRWP